MKKISLFLAAAALLSSCNGKVRDGEGESYAIINEGETIESIVNKAAHVIPSQRQFKWQRQELTAFIHFGINTFYGSEWGNGTEDPTRFNPTDLDAEQWVSTLAENGFKCAILTCKHHDGFCLWPSAYTEHSVKNSSWKDGKGDVVREVADACKKYGIGFGVYLSPWDRNSPLYGSDEYNDYFVNQLTELLTDYGDVAEVWFDGACGEGPNGRVQVYDFTRWYSLIRELQPEAVIAVMGPDVRWVGTESGRGRATEWSVVPNNAIDPEAIAANSQQVLLSPPSGDMTGNDLGSREIIAGSKALVWYPAEIDVSIRPGWFYHEDQDASVKTPQQLMDIYFTSVGMNGVLLLNIPPDTRGRFADADVQNLCGFTALRDKMYSSSVFRTFAQKGKARKMTDGNYDTYAVMKEGDELVFSFSEAQSFNTLCIQEDIRFGQRVEKFTLEVKNDDGSWTEVVEGSTIGHKRLIRFDNQKASEVKLKILGTRADALINEFDLLTVEY